jgi:hypothetical protein
MIATRRSGVVRSPEAAWISVVVARMTVPMRGVSLSRVATLHGIGGARAMCWAGRRRPVGGWRRGALDGRVGVVAISGWDGLGGCVTPTVAVRKLTEHCKSFGVMELDEVK